MPSPARSLAEDLRQRSDEQLQRLFDLRPHLLHPVPKSFADLALRANSAPATIIALDDLTRADLEVLEASCALAVAGRFGVADLAAGLDADEATITSTVAGLLDRVLLWGAGDDLRVPSAVREAFGREPGGLDPTPRPDLPVVRAALQDPEVFLADLAEAPDAAGAAAVRAAWGPATLPPPADPQEIEGQDWLAERGLLARDELGTLTLPRELALILRRGMLLREPGLVAPSFPASVAAVDDRAGYAADQFVREFDRVMANLRRQPWVRQANGAVSARDWDRALTALALDPGRLALHVSLAWATEQVAVDADNRVRPTTVFADGLSTPLASRWARLAAAWLSLPRAVPVEPARVLAIREDPLVQNARRLVLSGVAAFAGYDISGWLRWHRPRQQLSARLVNEVLAEAEALGFCVGAVPATWTRTLTWPASPARLADAVAPTLPALTDTIVLQADLTATALGPLEPAVERRLSEVADWESGGGATVFRFTPDSVRRGLAAGLDPDELTSWLASVALTPVPQALSVLVADLARAQAGAAVHAALSVVTCEPGVAAAILADPSLADLGLRSVADGVIVAQLPADVVVARLRGSGHLVTNAEPDSGSLLALDPAAGTRSDPTHPAAARIVRSLRMVERRSSYDDQPPQEVSASSSHAVQERLRAATARHHRLWLAFADQSGQRLTHLVEPLSVADGDVCAFDVTANEIRMIPLERIAGAAPMRS